ncbi:MAG: hypothetical protein ACRBCK_09095 [Alphaproteobacteria bacterium]
MSRIERNSVDPDFDEARDDLFNTLSLGLRPIYLKLKDMFGASGNDNSNLNHASEHDANNDHSL